MPNDENAAKRRRQRNKNMAMQIALQLPLEQDEALHILSEAKWLVQNFLTQDVKDVGPDGKARLAVVQR